MVEERELEEDIYRRGNRASCGKAETQGGK